MERVFREGEERHRPARLEREIDHGAMRAALSEVVVDMREVVEHQVPPGRRQDLVRRAAMTFHALVEQEALVEARKVDVDKLGDPSAARQLG